MEALSNTPYNNTPITEAQIVTKQLLTFLSDPKSYNPNAINEQKPVWSEEDEIGLGDALWAIEQAKTITKDENDMGNLWYAEHWLKSFKLQSKYKWNEDDDKMLDNVIQTVQDCIDYCDVDDVGTKARFCYEKEIGWLESLKQRMKGETK